jgi:hypothetical protein
MNTHQNQNKNLNGSATSSNRSHLNLKSLSDSTLLERTRQRVGEERAATCDILEYLGEIQGRMLYAKRGYSSLYEFCLKELGYSSGAAYRRIEAMKLSRDVPEAKEALNDGRLSLTTASTLQSFFDRERREHIKTYSDSEKVSLVGDLLGKSKQECEARLAELSPHHQVHQLAQDSSRVVTRQGDTEICFVASAELMKKISRYKGLTAHKHAHPSLAQVLEELLDLALSKLDRGTTTTTAPTGAAAKELPSSENLTKAALLISPEKRHSGACSEKQTSNVDAGGEGSGSGSGSASLPPSSTTRYIPASLKRKVWTRDQSRCSYQDPLTKKPCLSQYALQIDHIHPFALGGQHTLENLRLLCRTHNLLCARLVYGAGKMARSTRSSSTRSI